MPLNAYSNMQFHTMYATGMTVVSYFRHRHSNYQ